MQHVGQVCLNVLQVFYRMNEVVYRGVVQECDEENVQGCNPIICYNVFQRHIYCKGNCVAREGKSI